MNNTLKENLRVDVNFSECIRDYKRKEFVQQLARNKNLLKYLSNDRLEELLQYYTEENERKRNLLKKNNQ